MKANEVMKNIILLGTLEARLFRAVLRHVYSREDGASWAACVYADWHAWAEQRMIEVII